MKKSGINKEITKDQWEFQVTLIERCEGKNYHGLIEHIVCSIGRLQVCTYIICKQVKKSVDFHSTSGAVQTDKNRRQRYIAY